MSVNISNKQKLIERKPKKMLSENPEINESALNSKVRYQKPIVLNDDTLIR